MVKKLRIIGILTVGRDSITFDGEQNEIRVGGGVTITSSGQQNTLVWLLLQDLLVMDHN